MDVNMSGVRIDQVYSGYEQGRREASNKPYEQQVSDTTWNIEQGPIAHPDQVEMYLTWAAAGLGDLLTRSDDEGNPGQNDPRVKQIQSQVSAALSSRAKQLEGLIGEISCGT